MIKSSVPFGLIKPGAKAVLLLFPETLEVVVEFGRFKAECLGSTEDVDSVSVAYADVGEPGLWISWRELARVGWETEGLTSMACLIFSQIVMRIPVTEVLKVEREVRDLIDRDEVIYWTGFVRRLERQARGYASVDVVGPDLEKWYRQVVADMWQRLKGVMTDEQRRELIQVLSNR